MDIAQRSPVKKHLPNCEVTALFGVSMFWRNIPNSADTK